MTDHEETVERPEGKYRYREEVHCSNRFSVIAQERGPLSGRLRISRSFPYLSQHSSFRDVEAEHLQLAMYTRRAPGVVLGNHAKDQIAELLVAAAETNPTYKIVSMPRLGGLHHRYDLAA
jgi:hypothetical protein